MVVEELFGVTRREVLGDGSSVGEADVLHHLRAQRARHRAAQAPAELARAGGVEAGATAELFAERTFVAEEVRVHETRETVQFQQGVLERGGGEEQLVAAGGGVAKGGGDAAVGLVDVP